MQGAGGGRMVAEGVCDGVAAAFSFHAWPAFPLGKAAIAAGVAVLMRRFGITVGDLNRIYLAGALGNYVNPYSAMRIGLIPTTAPEKIVSLGNAASAGARLALLSKDHWRESADIAHRIEHIELSVQPDFEAHFIDAMDFPGYNLW